MRNKGTLLQGMKVGAVENCIQSLQVMSRRGRSLPLPLSIQSQNVPFVCASFTFNPKPLTLEDFESIPHKYGYNTHDLVPIVFGQQILERKTFIFHSWLFLGLLVQIFGPIGVT